MKWVLCIICVALYSTSFATTITLGWVGSDDGSGVAAVDVVWRFNNGPWAKYTTLPANGPTTVAFVIGNSPGVYEFASSGRDIAGNIEPLPTTADTSITITAAPLTTPTIATEPAWTAGTTNSITWSMPPAGILSELRWEKVGFAGTTTVLTVDNGYLVRGLEHNARYRYSVRYARDAERGPWSSWTYSRQDAKPPQTTIRKIDVIGPMIRNWGILQ